MAPSKNQRISHNADSLGALACRCHDAQLYDFTMDKRTYYDAPPGACFERCCHMAHMPKWEARRRSGRSSPPSGA